MSAVEKKKVIREQMRSQRQQLTAEQRSQAADELLNILSQALSDNDFPMAMYLPFDGELDTHPFIEQAWQAKRQIYLPVIQRNGLPILFRAYHSETILVANQYGIGEPGSGELVTAGHMKTICMPLTAFDRNGGRVGMGGGFYDITLADISQPSQQRPKLIGLGYEFQEVSECPSETHDQRLDAVATPSELIRQ